ncbi:MAG TPA: (d)CMP kinase [Candidatus Acidoferrales bacterium]|nr:(d)CMP kinase [Candidatus Acidoferrales bacterium]
MPRLTRSDFPLAVKNIVIAIDGPVGSGKSTAARRVAELLGYTYIDTGAMYRAVALKALRAKIAMDATEELVALAASARIDLRPEVRDTGSTQRVLLDGEDVTAAIRTPEVSQAASKIAVVEGVRHVLVAEQRRAGANGGVVMEGRDIGSVVFPDAELKVFLTASDEVRARRRWLEHQQKGDKIDLARTLEEVRERDRRDASREHSPLIRAEGAVFVDSTAMEVEEVARLIAMLARESLRDVGVQR